MHKQFLVTNRKIAVPLKCVLRKLKHWQLEEELATPSVFWKCLYFMHSAARPRFTLEPEQEENHFAEALLFLWRVHKNGQWVNKTA